MTKIAGAAVMHAERLIGAGVLLAASLYVLGNWFRHGIQEDE